MNIFITQNTYYFVHRHFLRFFNKKNSEIIFVREKNRGIKRKYLEFVQTFGLLKTSYFFLMEIIYLCLLFPKQLKLKKTFVDDYKLNNFLAKKLTNKNFSRIISIGCPCLIDSKLQRKFEIEIFNLHGGIIPFQKGRFSPIKAIKKNHKYLGASIHFIDETFDNGFIVSQDFFKVTNKNIIFNYNKVLKLSSFLLEDFLKGNYKSIPTSILNELKTKVI